MALDELDSFGDEQADGLSDDDSATDVADLEAFFAEDFEDGDEAALTPADDDVDDDDGDDQGAPRQSGPKSWKSMSDDEIRQADPGEIRSTITGLQRLTTQDRQETRDLQRQVIQLQQQMAQAVQAMQAQVAPQQREPAAPQQSIEDLMDDPKALMDWLQQTVQATVRQQVDPLRQTVDQNARDAVVAKLERQFAALQKAVPHFRDPSVQGKVIQKMEELGGAVSPQQAYLLLYPERYLEAKQRAVNARSKPTNEPQKAAVVPPGRRTAGKKDVAALVGDDLIDAMASELEKSGDLKKVAPPARLPR